MTYKYQGKGTLLSPIYVYTNFGYDSYKEKQNNASFAKDIINDHSRLIMSRSAGDLGMSDEIVQTPYT